MDYEQHGRELIHFTLPPSIDLQAIELFGEDMIPICESKIKELYEKWDQIKFKKNQYNFLIEKTKQQGLNPELVYSFKVNDTAIDEEYIQKWIVYWYRVKKFAIKEPIFPDNQLTDVEIERARSFPYSELLGGKFKAPCPFHKEKSASFMVYKRENYGKCFGCQWYGSTIDFVMQKEDMNFQDAVKYLNR